MKVTQSCPTLCYPMDYTVHGILQARILEWVAFPFSRGSSQPRDWTLDSCIAGRFFTSWATREDQEYWSGQCILLQGTLAWVAISYPKRFSQPLGSNLHFLCLLVLVGRFFTISSTQEVLTCVELQSLWL